MTLENLFKIKQLKQEPPDQREFDGFVRSARTKLQDAKCVGLSEDSKFSLTYITAHSLALAALRWHGYRSENRYTVQCLPHTVGLDNAKWRVLDKCHYQRNLAEYEGHLEITPQLLEEFVAVTEELFGLVTQLGPVTSA
ncbi:MAG: hypothetical protein ACKVOA_01275 [Methylophilaceae bacterium]